ncbi:MAG: copper chaperone PCu(A)C [Alphaproteobacteria bacterium]|nr:copper chaperone PCu(A)C [Alphaproteobacteria bacterium]MBV9372828.1 copper chaperone PCu(A)C [Alphaproteobacteria bacterium]MBV9900477.1 copper chaperone PCu(A)C [Alphaproteobacteria bacterium]
MKVHPILAACMALAPALAACRSEPEALAVRDAWVRLPAVRGQPAGAYFRIVGGAEGSRLVGLSSPMARRIELHESMTKGGMARMKPVKEVEFSYQGRIVFEPGGKHAMLFGLNPAVREGGTLPLTFAFDTAPPLTVEAEVRGPSGESHGH